MNNDHDVGDFTNLTPDALLDAIEHALTTPMTGFAHPLNSYINRVYEVQTCVGTRLIAKFYRPGRWPLAALQAEHAFVQECAAAEIPVVAPLPLSNGTTLGAADGIFFAVYNKRRGREFEPVDADHWRRLGRIIGRMHSVGSVHAAPARITLHPEVSTAADIGQLRSADVIPARFKSEFKRLSDAIMATIVPLFADAELIRIHGDCHQGNLLERPEEGLMLIDFDDMAMGPPVQDLWMLLPGHRHEVRQQIDFILSGYEDFREFDDCSLKLIEPLRIMRILYFMAWCCKQRRDPNFQIKFPDWGSEAFWSRELTDLQRQLNIITSAS